MQLFLTFPNSRCLPKLPNEMPTCYPNKKEQCQTEMTNLKHSIDVM